MAETRSFEVYLTEEAASAVDDEPLVADSLDFYDSGVWVTHAAGRDFFPYERLVRIHDASEGDAPRVDEPERDDAGGDDVDTDARAVSGETTVGERRDASSGASESVDGTDAERE